MKLNANEQKEAVIIGDIETNKVGIDRNNIDFITTLLTTNLYSNPLGSFLRETIANGQDSQKEAGVEHPLLLIINKELNSANDHYTISIRDFGTGVSPERFDKIYRNIGSSTKRESNDYIGAFGIGRFSALAVSNIVFINSYYEGTCYSYLMYKDGTSISIDKISETKGDFENGLEVKLDYEYSHYYKSIGSRIIEELNSLKYFTSLYVDCQVYDSDKTTKFNNRKIQKFKNFITCDFTTSYHNEIGCVIGNVWYPLESSYIQDLKGIVSNIDLLFDIGDLDITPNREALRYSPKTISAIQNKVSATIEEIKDACKSQCFGDFDSIMPLLEYLSNSQIEVVVGNHPIIITTDFCNRHAINIPIKINGETLPTGFRKACIALMEHKWDNHITDSSKVLYEVANEKFYTKSFNSLQFYIIINKFRNKTLYHTNGRLSGISKKYFKETVYKKSTSYGTVMMLKSNELNTIKYNIFKRFKDEANNKEVLKALLKYFYPIYKDFVTQYVFNNDSVPQSYKDANKATVTKNNTSKGKASTNNIAIYTLETSSKYSYTYRGYGPVATANIDLFNDLKNYKGCIVYASKDDTTIDYIYYLWSRSKLFSIIKTPRKIKFIKVAPSKLLYLKELNNAIYISDYIDSAPAYLRYICEMFSFNKKITADETLNNLSDFFGSTSTLHLFKSEINRLLMRAQHYIQDFRYDFNTSVIEPVVNELTTTYKNTNKLDLSVEQNLLENNKILKLLRFIEIYRCTKTDILVNFCLKQKICIPSLGAYKQYKQSIYCN